MAERKRGIDVEKMFRKNGIERKINLESLDVTPESLLADNKSKKAKELGEKWKKNKDNHNIWVVVACGDARVLIPNPENIESVRSINAGGKKEKKIFENESVKFVVVMTHIDGSTIVLGKRPKGCGGAAAKEEAMNGNGEERVEGIDYYIDNNIDHPDTIVQAYNTAKKIFQETGKPTLATVQDHRTGEIYVLAAFIKGEKPVKSEKLDWIDSSKEYNEAEIYSNGIPTIQDFQIPEIFKDYLDANKEYVAQMNQEYDLNDIQETQNPRMIFISSKLPSIRTRYPETTKYPNSVFKLHLPREKDGERKEISPAMRREIANQAQYPIEYAVKHFGKPNESFSKTDRVIIETSDINNSRSLAAELVKKPWMKAWLELPDHKIIVIQNKEGVADIAEWFEPELVA